MNVKWEDFLAEKLQNSEKALMYLNATLHDPDEDIFLIALKDVVRSHLGGMTALAEETNLSRESLYRTLSLNGNPRFSTLLSILDALDLQLAIQPKKRKRKVSKKAKRAKPVKKAPKKTAKRKRVSA